MFKTVKTGNDIEHQAADGLTMNGLMRLTYSEISLMTETCRRGVKQLRGAERCQARPEQARRNHVGLSPRAFLFLRLEYQCFVKGISWFEAKTSIIRDAVRACLAKPIYTLEPVKLEPVKLYATA